MAKKKNLKDISNDDAQFIDNKFNETWGGSYTKRIPCSFAINYTVDLKCKNDKQKALYNACKKSDIVLCSGVFGCGKSYVINATSLEMLRDPKMPYKQIVIIVPTVEAGNMNLGYLKGDLDTKLSVYLDSDFYCMEKILNNSNNKESGKKIVDQLRKCEYVIPEPLSFVRGKTFENSLILVNEAENFNISEMLLILSRIGENSKLFVSGDPLQLDRKDIKKSNDKCGLEYAIEKLQTLEECSIILFDENDIVRNPIITKIWNLWKN